MKTKYYRYTLDGEHTADDARSAIGDAGKQGLVVRVENAGGETHIYLASDGSSAPEAKSVKSAKGVRVKEVTEKDVTKI